MSNQSNNPAGYVPRYHVPATQVISELNNYMLVDGFDLVLDLGRSIDSHLYDQREGKKFTDFFTCFASVPLGLNHPKMTDDGFVQYLASAAMNKPSNSDIYTEQMATFVKTFFKTAVPDYFKYSFFICGGALAVSNALKTAFDWKHRKNLAKGLPDTDGSNLKIMHFEQAFHGRSGYTMSLTNTDPNKIKYFPKFNDWPRIINPKMAFPFEGANVDRTIELEQKAIAQMKDAFAKFPNDIAAIIIEPIQGEGGDNQFRPEFLRVLRQLANENEALLIFDEIQTGVGITGEMWAHQIYDVRPDIMTFGKKMQVCGILAGDRLDEIPDHVFKVSSRINSTWGGNLVDMVRSTRYLEIIEEDKVLDNVRAVGAKLQDKLFEMEKEFPTLVSNVRGKGMFCAYDLPNSELRDAFRGKCYDNGLIILGCGDKSIRFRPALNMQVEQLNEGFDIIRKSLAAVSK